MVSNGVDSVISTLNSECQRGENFTEARINGKSNHDPLKNWPNDVSTSRSECQGFEFQTHASKRVAQDNQLRP